MLCPAWSFVGKESEMNLRAPQLLGVPYIEHLFCGSKAGKSKVACTQWDQPSPLQRDAVLWLVAAGQHIVYGMMLSAAYVVMRLPTFWSADRLVPHLRLSVVTGRPPGLLAQRAPPSQTQRPQTHICFFTPLPTFPKHLFQTPQNSSDVLLLHPTKK